MLSKKIQHAALGLICSGIFVSSQLAPVRAEGWVEQSSPAQPEKQQNAQESSQQLRQLIRRLGSSSFAERRQAFSELWQKSGSASQLLSEASIPDDKEVDEAVRRLKILGRLRDHCDDLPTALGLMELVAIPSESNLVKLAADGRWGLISFYLDEHPAMAIRAQETFFQQESTHYLIQRLVDCALEQKQVQLAWPVIARLVPFELAAWTSHYLELPHSVPERDEHERAVRLFLVGEPTRSLELNISPQLKLRLATRGFQWQLLGEESVQRALLEGPEAVGQQAARAILLEFAGDGEAAEQLWSTALGLSDASGLADPADTPEPAAIDLLRQAASDATSPSSYHQLLFSLLLGGHKAILEQFLEQQSPGLAFDLAAASNDYTRALRQVGLEPELHNFETWLNQMTAEANRESANAERATEGEPLSLPTAITLGKVGSIIVGLGYRREAQQILDQLVLLGERTYRRQNPIWDRCILRWMGRDEWRSCCIETISDRLEAVPKAHRRVIFSKLFPELGGYAWNLFRTAPALSLELPEKQKLRMAFQQLESLELLDRSCLGDQHQQAFKDWVYRSMRSEDEEEQGAENDGPALLPLIELAHSMGYTAVAMDLLQLGVSQTLDTARLLQFAAKISMETQNADTALTYLDTAEPGVLDHHLDFATRIRARLALGQFDEARQDQLAHWMRMSGLSWNGDRSAGYRATEDLISDGLWEQALPYANRNFLMDRFASYYFGFWEARQYSRILQELEDYQRSADVMRAIFVELLRPHSQTLRVFVANEELSLLSFSAVRERISRAIALVGRQDYESARHELKVAFQLQPLDIEAVVHCFPLLQKAGQAEFAEELFRRYETALQAHLQEWPNDAMNLNNLAWMYSQCDRQLEEGLTLSERSVGLAPSSVIYLDTLAEVHFRLGNYEQAIALMRECVRRDPRAAHYRENLVRFSKR